MHSAGCPCLVLQHIPMSVLSIRHGLHASTLCIEPSHLVQAPVAIARLRCTPNVVELCAVVRELAIGLHHGGADPP